MTNIFLYQLKLIFSGKSSKLTTLPSILLLYRAYLISILDVFNIYNKMLSSHITLNKKQYCYPETRRFHEF